MIILLQKMIVILVQGISTDKYGLGFFGLAYYEENKDKLKSL